MLSFPIQQSCDNSLIFSVRITFKDGYLIDLYQGDLTFTDKQKQKHYYNLANINELLEEIKTIIEKDI